MKKILIIISLIAACGVYVAEGQSNNTAYTFRYTGSGEPPCDPVLNDGWKVSHGTPCYIEHPIIGGYHYLNLVSSANIIKSEGAFVYYNFSKNNKYQVEFTLKQISGSPKLTACGATGLVENKALNCEEGDLPNVDNHIIGYLSVSCSEPYYCHVTLPSNNPYWIPAKNYNQFWITSENPTVAGSFFIYMIVIKDFGKVESNPPTVPGNLRTTLVEAKKITVQWDASYDASGVAGYEVFLNGTSKGTTQRTEYTFSNLTKCTPYTIEVRAYDIYDNYSAKTPPLSVQTLDDKPGDIVLDKPIILAGGQQIEEATNSITLKPDFSVAATTARELFHAKIVSACPNLPQNILHFEAENPHNTKEEDEDYSMSLLSEENSELRIYPNPTSDRLTIEYHQFTGVKKIVIFDIMGRLVFDDNLSGVVSEIDVSAFPSGVYFIKVITQDKALMKKLIKK